MTEEKADTKLYKKRWLILALFACYSASNAFQWIHYSIISNVVSRFYNVPLTTVDWLSMVYMLVYIPLIFPVTWLLDKKGVRTIALLGTSLNAVGALIKVASARPDLFAVTMFGQTVCSIAQVFILGMPAKVAATWFGANEVSTACSLGVFGNQLGNALGFLLPPLIVPDVEDIDVLQTTLRYMFIGTAVVTSLLFVLVIFVFDERPILPPSLAQKQFIEGKVVNNEAYVKSIKQLLQSPPSIFLILSYGANVGSFYAISTLLNREILTFYPDAIKQAGQMGLTMVFTGIVGAILCGIILDRTKAFRATTRVIYTLSFLSMIMYACTLSVGQIWIVFVTIGILGFFMTGYLPIGFEFAAEITYPVSEGTSSGLLNASAQIFGILFTISMGYLIPKAGILGANIFLSAMLLSGTFLTWIIKSRLKRHEANSKSDSFMHDTSF